MDEPFWIEKIDCLSYHAALLDRFGGLTGMRDEGLLESAIARPLQLFRYESPSHFELAACYALGIVKNHPFLDGNKRSGLMAAQMFLEINGWVFQAPEEEAVVFTRALAAGELGEAEYAEWLKRSSASRK